MAAVVRLHHVEFLCCQASERALTFAESYGFKPFAKAIDAVAVKSGSSVFVFRERSTADYLVDTVKTLALEVDCPRQAFDSALEAGASAESEPLTSKSELGSCSTAAVRTPFGNVCLLFVHSKDFSGCFLPGFSGVECDESHAEMTSYCDHITFACPLGSLDQHVAWYERCLGFRRFILNRTESDEYGFVVDSELGNVGLRLKAMDYWRCSEIGVSSNGRTSSGREVKLVFAEPLEGVGANQVQTFLDEHRGPGIQHIGLHTADIAAATESLQKHGVSFVCPPPEYYQELRSSLSWPSQQLLATLQEHSILLDSEDRSPEDPEPPSSPRYLMQAFTQSLFSERTFFLELIYRAGAQGFGAGNISALWRALQHHLHSVDAKQT